MQASTDLETLMLTHTSTAPPLTAIAGVLAVLRFILRVCSAVFSVGFGLLRALAKFIGLSLLFMTEMW